MRQTQYCGFYSPQERWAHRSRAEGFPIHETDWKIAPPTLHDRLVAHTIEISTIQDPIWNRTGKGTLMIPSGKEELLMTVDLGQELRTSHGKTPYVEEIISRDTVRKLADRTYIRGDIYRHVLPGTLGALEGYVSIIFENNGYSFSFRPEIQKYQHVTVYDLLRYVTIDGKKVDEKKERVVPQFCIPEGKREPPRFGRWKKIKKRCLY